MYKIFITSSAKKAAKKLPKIVRFKAIEVSQKLVNTPFLGEKLSGSLYFLHSLHFKVGGKEYRLAYTIDQEKKIIFVHLVQIREGFYQRLKRLFR